MADANYLGKAFVLSKRPRARLQFALSEFVIEDWGSDDVDELGRGKDPQAAWHDAANNLQTEND